MRMADIRREWEWMRPKVEVIRRRCSRDWRCEDVYHACLARQAFLYVSSDADSAQRGFMVVQEAVNEFTAEPYLFVWLVYWDGGGGIGRWMPEVKSLAKEFGFREIFFESPRREWAAVSGVEETMIKYRIEVDA